VPESPPPRRARAHRAARNSAHLAPRVAASCTRPLAPVRAPRAGIGRHQRRGGSRFGVWAMPRGAGAPCPRRRRALGRCAGALDDDPAGGAARCSPRDRRRGGDARAPRRWGRPQRTRQRVASACARPPRSWRWGWWQPSDGSPPLPVAPAWCHAAGRGVSARASPAVVAPLGACSARPRRAAGVTAERARRAHAWGPRGVQLGPLDEAAAATEWQAQRPCGRYSTLIPGHFIAPARPSQACALCFRARLGERGGADGTPTSSARCCRRLSYPVFGGARRPPSGASVLSATRFHSENEPPEELTAPAVRGESVASHRLAPPPRGRRRNSGLPRAPSRPERAPRFLSQMADTEKAVGESPGLPPWLGVVGCRSGGTAGPGPCSHSFGHDRQQTADSRDLQVLKSGPGVNIGS